MSWQLSGNKKEHTFWQLPQTWRWTKRSLFRHPNTCVAGLVTLIYFSPTIEKWISLFLEYREEGRKCDLMRSSKSLVISNSPSLLTLFPSSTLSIYFSYAIIGQLELYYSRSYFNSHLRLWFVLYDKIGLIWGRGYHNCWTWSWPVPSSVCLHPGRRITCLLQTIAALRGSFVYILTVSRTINLILRNSQFTVVPCAVTGHGQNGSTVQNTAWFSVVWTQCRIRETEWSHRSDQLTNQIQGMGRETNEKAYTENEVITKRYFAIYRQDMWKIRKLPPNLPHGQSQLRYNWPQ